MELETEPFDLDTATPTVVIHREDAEALGVHAMERVELSDGTGTTVGVVKVTTELIEPGTIGVTRPLMHLEGSVDVRLSPTPQSTRYVRRKLEDIELDHTEIRSIVQDIYHDRLTDIELTAYVCGLQANGLSLEETTALTECMADVGSRIRWDDAVIADKHCIGGVPGNRTTPIIVAIVAAAGVKIPKTSSRAITSPAGTADTMEVFCNVELGQSEIEAVVRKVNGCVAWGGAVDLSPVDDRIIEVETPLSLDPEGQVIASVLSKKRSAGSTHVVVDIPYGESAKVVSLAEARRLSRGFKRVGEHLDVRIECAITRGDGPIGRGIGPALEAREVLAVLEGDGPSDLRSKSVELASILLERCGVDTDAEMLLESGRALGAFRDIIEAQGGDRDVTREDIEIGSLTETVVAKRDGVVTNADNGVLAELGRRAGAPKDKGAGVELHVTTGEAVDLGDPLLTIHAESAAKRDDAAALEARADVFRIRRPEEMVIEKL
jgi:AMP phosphorylase